MAPRLREIVSSDADLEAEPLLVRPVARASGAQTALAPLPHPIFGDIFADAAPGGPIESPGDDYPPATPIVVIGGNSDDYIYGGAGNDTLIGNGGDDFISAGDGNDYLSGGAGHDRLKGGGGDDTIHGGAGHDELRGNHGNDRLFGDAGNDVLLAGDGDDLLDGGAGTDVLDGGTGNDVLLGGAGNDTLNGGDGTDRLDGGKGRDVLTGGGGRDVFVADLNGNAWNSNNYQPDVVTDFTGGYSYGRDQVDLGPILAKTLFAGSSAYEAYQQGFVYLTAYYDPATSTYGTRVMVDHNGHAPDLGGGMGDIAVLELQGVSPSELSFYGYNGHFIV
jgi:Ca2+-binding RTX toxin-like protein